MRGPVRAAVRRLGTRRWFSALGRRIVPLDLAVQRRTAGRLGVLRLLGMPSLLLTARGARTGRPRSVPLLHVPEAGRFVVIGSNWGRAGHPAWSANLLAHPDAVVTSAGREVPVRARLVTGAERERLWHDVIVPAWPAYATYDERAGDRELRVFSLEPVR
ncbi:nitroreductase/quinone reductase family protein [Saccharopolyspora cebuensis]|uniref:Nitroreductase/quinone reductase family protein n=1 Tax=Saccharopolyspora cebuensis TaxID=418759 RepID=A0ABV4CCV5_9PSEU